MAGLFKVATEAEDDGRLLSDRIRNALSKFGGVRRRFTRIGDWNGVPIIDDYGHHPVEISAVLRAARETSSGRVIAVAMARSTY